MLVTTLQLGQCKLVLFLLLFLLDVADEEEVGMSEVVNAAILN